MKPIRNLSSDEYYDKFYVKILRSGIIGSVTDFGQRQMERKFRSEHYFENVLELGAGNGQHFRYIKCNFGTYAETDIRIDSLTEKAIHMGTQTRFQLDAEHLSEIEDCFYDRVIATCLLTHLSNPSQALKSWRRVTKPNGYISIWVACEPGMLLRLSRFLTSNLIARKNGVDHLSYLYREHKINYLTCKHAIREVFVEDLIEEKYFPFRYLSWNFNFWKIYTIKKAGKCDQNI